LARTTTGFSGADLANLCNEAALVAARHDHDQVTMPDFEEAVDKILLGEVRPLLMNDHDRRVVAYHERATPWWPGSRLALIRSIK